MGFVAASSIRLFDPGARTPGARWYDIPRKALGVGSRFKENDVAVGYGQRRGAFLRFKIRPPLHELAAADVRDARSLSRGAVCETRPRGEQVELACRLKALHRAEAQDLSSAELCAAILARLLLLEEGARAGAGGMMTGTRYFYTFADPLPQPMGAPRRN